MMLLSELLSEISNIGNMHKMDVDSHKTSNNDKLTRLQVELTDYRYRTTIVVAKKGIGYYRMYYQIELKENTFWSLDRIKFYDSNVPITYFLSMIEDEFEKNQYG